MEGPKVWYDDATGIVFNGGTPATTPEAARDALRRAGELMDGKSQRLMLVDLREAPLTLPTDVRKALMDEVRTLRLDRQAFVVGNPVIRMLAKAIARVAGTAGEAAFFDSTEEAVAWLTREC